MICRDLTETKTITIQDAEFIIGVIPKRTWRDVSLKLGAVSGHLKKFKGKKVEEISGEPEFQKSGVEIQNAYFDLVRLGVRGHKGLKKADGSEISFKADEKGFADASMVEIYDLNDFLLELGGHVLEFNTVTETERKN